MAVPDNKGIETAASYGISEALLATYPELRTVYELFKQDNIGAAIEALFKTNYYNTRIDSYYPIDKDILYDLQSNGEYQYWEGNRFDTDYHDTDVTNDSVVEVTKLKRK